MELQGNIVSSLIGNFSTFDKLEILHFNLNCPEEIFLDAEENDEKVFDDSIRLVDIIPCHITDSDYAALQRIVPTLPNFQVLKPDVHIKPATTYDGRLRKLDRLESDFNKYVDT